MQATKMTTIGKAEARTLGEATRAALEAVAEEYGLTLKVAGGSYDPHAGTFSPKVTFSAEGAEQAKFAAQCFAVGVWIEAEQGVVHLVPSDYRAEFQWAGKRFTLTGVNLRAPKYPLVAEGEDGKAYKLPEDAVRAIVAVRDSGEEA